MNSNRRPIVQFETNSLVGRVINMLVDTTYRLGQFILYIYILPTLIACLFTDFLSSPPQ